MLSVRINGCYLSNKVCCQPVAIPFREDKGETVLTTVHFKSGKIPKLILAVRESAPVIKVST